MDNNQKKNELGPLPTFVLILCGVLVIVFLYLVYITMEDSFVAGLRILFVPVCFVGILYGYWKYLSYKKNRDQQKADNDCVKYADKTLVVKKTSSDLRDKLTIKKWDAPLLKIVPEQYHVGAVTVGGVTSGGVYKTDAYSTVGGQINTDKYKIYYCKEAVNTIIFENSTVLAKAKASNIGKYINANNEILVENHSNMTPNQFDAIIKLNNEAAYNDALRAFIKGMPNQEKCQAIVDWLCSNQH